MSLNKLKKAIKKRNVDKISLVIREIEENDRDEAIKLINNFYTVEMNRSAFIYNFILECRDKRDRKQTGINGLKTYDEL